VPFSIFYVHRHKLGKGLKMQVAVILTKNIEVNTAKHRLVLYCDTLSLTESQILATFDCSREEQKHTAVY